MKWSKVLTWNAEKHKVPRASIIHNLQLIEIYNHDIVQDSGYVAFIIRVAYVVDSHPHAEE